MRNQNGKLLKRVTNDYNSINNKYKQGKKYKYNIFCRKTVIFAILCIFAVLSLNLSARLFDIFKTIELVSRPKYNHNIIKQNIVNNDQNKENVAYQNYEYEDYDRIFGNLINNSRETKNYDQLIRIWTQEYLKYYLREPPTNYEKWIRLAVDNKCYLHPKYYKQV